MSAGAGAEETDKETAPTNGASATIVDVPPAPEATEPDGEQAADGEPRETRQERRAKHRSFSF